MPVGGRPRFWLCPLLALLAAVAWGDSSWPYKTGPCDGSRTVVAGPRRGGTPLGGYTADLLLWRRAVRSADRILSGDVDGDGRPELVVSAYDSQRGTGQTDVLDSRLRTRWTRASPLAGLALVADVDGDGDGRSEVVVTWPGRRTPAGRYDPPPYLEVWDGRGNLAWRWAYRPTPEEERKAPELSLLPMFADDVDLDGRVEIGVFQDTAPWVQRRRLFLLREGDARPIASADTVLSQADVIAVGDLVGDRKHEIVFGGYANSTGVSGHGIADSDCRVLAFDCRLRLLWVTAALGGEFTGARPAFAREERWWARPWSGPRLSLFLWSLGGSRSSRGAVIALAPSTGEVLHQRPYSSPVRGGAIGPVSEGRHRLTVSLSNSGQFECLDDQLRPTGAGLQFRGPDASLQFAADLDGDGRLELIATPEPGCLSLTDLSFSRATRVVTSGARDLLRRGDAAEVTCIPWDADADGAPEVAALACAPGGDSCIEVYQAVPAAPLARPSVRRHPRWPAGISSFEWAPDGRHLLATNRIGSATLYSWSQERPAWVATLPELRAAAFSPDGRSLAALVGGRPAKRPAWACATCAAPARSTPVVKGLRQTALLDDLAPVAGARLVLIDATTGTRRDLATGTFDRHLAWTARGMILVSQERGKTLDILTYSTGAAPPRPVVGASEPDIDEACPVAVPDDDLIAYTRWEAVEVPYADAQPAAQLYRVPAKGGRATCVTTHAAVCRGLWAPGSGAGPSFLQWRAEPTNLLFSGFRGSASARRGPFVVGEMTVWTAATSPALRRTSLYATSDLWVANLQAGELRTLTFDDDQEESSPSLSPDGNWVAYRSVATTDRAAGPNIAVTNLTQSSSLTVGPGDCPRWSPTDPAQLWFLREGRLWAATLRNQTPPVIRASRRKWLGGALGLLCLAVCLVLRLPRRLRVTAGSYARSIRAARETGQSLLLTAMIRRLDRAQATLHALKNTVTVVTAHDLNGNAATAATLRYVYDAENAVAVRKGVDQVLASIADIATHAQTDRALLMGLPTGARDGLAQCLAQLAGSRHRLERCCVTFHQDRAEYAAAVASGGLPSPALCERALANLGSFRHLLTDEQEQTGLLDRLRECLRPLQIRTVLREAAAATTARAATVGATVEVAAGVSPMLYVPGNPELLGQVVLDTIANSLDAVADRSALAEAGYEGRIELNATERSDTVVVTVTDNGVGLTEDTLTRLNGGTGVTTRGLARGGGFLSARRTLSRYPGGQVRIESDGPQRGATVTIAMQAV